MTAIALIVGHNARAQGAVRATDGRTEYDWCGDLAAAIKAHGPGMYAVIRRQSHPSGYASEIRNAYVTADAMGVSATVELHFNGGPATATGTETLTSGTKGSLRLARLIQPAMVGALGLRDRGLLTRGRNDRGGESLWAGRAPAVLLEPYFGSREADCQAADRHYAALAAAIHRACVAFINGA
ncbi:N-acetylmuramoyl-L-alanine amidase [Gemmobacter sp.]|uniref:N-acetylmuramoyl-L-alanine amidase n=1 Tax=Gemmobacter sp. TaxID=1898957 RepID=UPI002AFF4ABC|nr:N-acetylmuramoyl-L-alanine amidase [Gemmobacter sp.]